MQTMNMRSRKCHAVLKCSHLPEISFIECYLGQEPGRTDLPLQQVWECWHTTFSWRHCESCAGGSWHQLGCLLQSWVWFLHVVMATWASDQMSLNHRVRSQWLDLPGNNMGEEKYFFFSSTEKFRQFPWPLHGNSPAMTLRNKLPLYSLELQFHLYARKNIERVFAAQENAQQWTHKNL